jgi:hypothetical protein
MNFFKKQQVSFNPILPALPVLIVCIGFAVIQVSCKKKCEDPAILRTGVVAAIPWQQGQTVKYKTNEGDTFSVTATRTYKEADADNNCEEYLEIVLKDPKNTYPFVESVQRGVSVDSMIQIVVSPRRKNGLGSIVQFYVTKDQKLAGFNTGVYATTALATATINGKQYTDVLKLDYNTPATNESISQFFYNKTFGILQCRTKGGFVITLN